MGRGKTGEYERHCRRCGHVWYIPTALANMKPRRQAKAAGWTTPVVGRRRQALRADAALIDNQNRQIAENQRCPQCGSTDFAQGKPGQVAAAAPPPPAPAPTAGWYPDPTGRFVQRYHDGAAWTTHVSGGDGQTITDLEGAS